MKNKIEQSIDYYSGETSLEYSHVRYAPPINSYVKYVFTTRLRLFLDLLEKAIDGRQNLSIFEIGCADGILFKNINKSFPGAFSSLVGIDITPDMVEVARREKISQAEFYLRGEDPAEKSYDVIIEIGVHTVDVEEEIAYVKSKLKPGGYYIKTFSSRRSTQSQFKLRGKPWLADIKTYPEYGQILAKHFEIVSSPVYCLFVPKLWSLPWPIALSLQKTIDFICRPFVPNIFHEKIYLLKSRP